MGKIDIYLTDKTKNQRLRFPITPDTVGIKTGALQTSFTVIKLGEVRIPRGSQLRSFSWTGVLPDKTMNGQPFVFDWQEPASIIKTLEGWEEAGTALNLMITELSINLDVYIDTFTYNYRGMGRAEYSIGLTAKRSLTVTTIAAPKKPAATAATTSVSDTTNATVNLSNKNGTLTVYKRESTSSIRLGTLKHGERIHVNKKNGNWYEIPYSTGTNGVAYVQASYVKLDTQKTTSTSSSVKPKTVTQTDKITFTWAPATYTTKTGDNWYALAKSLLGDGSRWQELYNLNAKAAEEANKGKNVSRYTVQPGMKIQLPEKKTTTTTQKTTTTTTTQKTTNITSAASSSKITFTFATAAKPTSTSAKTTPKVTCQLVKATKSTAFSFAKATK